MPSSMTGFGRGEATRGGIKATVEARSVNQRFLNVSTRMPGWLSPLESSIRKIVGDSVTRGNVDVSVDLDGEDARSRVTVDAAAVASCAAEWRRLKSELDLPGEVDVAALAGCDALLSTEQPRASADDVRPALEEALSSAMEQLVAARIAEGEATAKDILANVDKIADGAAVIEGRVPEAVAESMERMKTRVAELLGGSRPELSGEEIAREVAILADKSDVAEELSRLKTHVDQVRSLLGSTGETGRKLEFLVQEMNREINTIGSKTSDLEVTAVVVDLKVALERIREQARNVE